MYRSGLAQLALAVSFACPAIADPVPPSVADRVAQSVVELTSSDCDDGRSRTGSGFVFQSSNQIVTAHHVVAGCRTFAVFFERADGRTYRGAVLAKALPRSDLAMLTVSGPNVRGLSLQNRPAQAGDMLSAIGYSLQQPTLGDLDVNVSIGASKLSDFLPPQLAQDLRVGTQIDLNAEVVRLKSPLEPGMSGGPIVDAEGKVVAVVAGGLRDGTVPASWGWPAPMLSALLGAQGPTTGPSRVSPTLFSMTKDTSPRDTRQCGGLQFYRANTLSYGEVLRVADDSDAVRRIAAISARPQNVIDRFRFDIWRHRASGAAVAVPAGVSLQAVGDRCIARLGPLEEVIQGEPAAGPQDVQQATARFELQIAQEFREYAWQQDAFLGPGWPMTRADGLVVNRKGAIGLSLTQPKQAHFTETLMARGGTVVSISAINRNYGPQYQPCIYMPASAECARVAEELTNFARFVLAVQLSTYSVF